MSSASSGHRRKSMGSLPVRGGVAERRALLSPVLAYCIGAVALLAYAGHISFQKLILQEQLCLGSSWCISWTPVAQTDAPKYQGVKYELHTLPVDARAVTDGDTITVYVDIADHLESSNVPPDVHRAAVDQAKVPTLRGEQVLTNKYRVRLRGIDAPEGLMPYGKEAKEGLVKLVQGKSLKISVYDHDRYGRLVGDVHCEGVFVQEYMLKNGHAWHYTAYDHRMELTKWENHAKLTRTGLWALPNPEKPWEWRKQKRIGTA